MTEYHGRVILTWPAASGPYVMAWGLTAHDADTGQQFTDVTSLTMTLGSPDDWDGGPMEITLTRLVDENGQPLGTGINRIVPTDAYQAWDPEAVPGSEFEGQRFRTAEFRYLVAEMRTAADPTIPTRESVNRGEHSINQYRRHHGITDDRNMRHPADRTP